MFRDESHRKICLVDFDLATLVPRSGLVSGMCGTMGYVAPEVVRGHAYGFKADAFSLGVVAFVLLGVYLPFSSELGILDMDAMLQGKLEFHLPEWTGVSSGAKDFVRSLLCEVRFDRGSLLESTHRCLESSKAYECRRSSASHLAYEDAAGVCI